MRQESIKNDSTTIMGKKCKGTGLKYVPTNKIDLIPRYLIGQVNGLEFEVDRFYKLAKMIEGNPMNFIGLFVDSDNAVQGFMWSTYNPLADFMFVNILSVSKEYQGMGIANEAVGICRKILKNIGASQKIACKTTRHRAMARFGFKKAEYTYMELEE